MHAGSSLETIAIQSSSSEQQSDVSSPTTAPSATASSPAPMNAFGAGLSNLKQWNPKKYIKHTAGLFKKANDDSESEPSASSSEPPVQQGNNPNIKNKIVALASATASGINTWLPGSSHRAGGTQDNAEEGLVPNSEAAAEAPADEKENEEERTGEHMVVIVARKIRNKLIARELEGTFRLDQ